MRVVLFVVDGGAENTLNTWSGAMAGISIATCLSGYPRWPVISIPLIFFTQSRRNAFMEIVKAK